MQNTCSQLALSLIISCFHCRPGRAVPMPKACSPFSATVIEPVEDVLALETNFVQLSLQITSATATHSASKRIDFHVYVKGWLRAKVYIIVHNAKFSHNIKRKIIFPFMRSEILLFVHSFVLATALIMNTVHTILCFS